MSHVRTITTATAALAVAASTGLLAPAQADPPGGSDRSATVAPPTSPADLDVLFVGAHPDDESGRLSMFGEWRERFGARTGVVTITRGEGGGNAVGPEEGPALGLIREHEERDAVGRAGVTDVYNLDKVDFYYSVSAPLHQQAWDAEETLGRLVRVIRQTRPEVITTMTPAPSPGNHGGHQEASLLAIEAYQVAGDPEAFPKQITDEGLTPFAPSKILTTGALGTATGTGPDCATAFTPTNPADDVYGVWSGRESTRYGTTWAQVERDAQREYASQGWSGFPDVNPDPDELGCDYMAQIDARVPFTRGDLTAEAAASATMLEGAVLRAHDGLPLGSGLDLATPDLEVAPGTSTTLTLTVTAPEDQALLRARASLEVPKGWVAGRPTLRFGTVPAGETRSRTVKVTAPAGAATNKRILVGARVSSPGFGSGYTDQQLQVVPLVSGTQQLLPQVRIFHEWAQAHGVEQLQGTVPPVLTLPSVGARTVVIDVTNNDTDARSGRVTLDLPDGFSATPKRRSYDALAPGESTQVRFRVTNTDDSLETSMQGGDYAYTVTTTSDGGAAAVSRPALELVPATAVTQPSSGSPKLDGTIGADEYTAEIDLSRLWEGTACADAADCSATGHLARHGDDLYVAADVTDDTMGTLLSKSDCKRHWRVDSVEIAIDPDGRSENTSSTFKAAVLPETDDGGPCAARDADNHQGPIRSTAPGVRIAATMKDDGTGYVVEAKIPARAFPSTIDPDRVGFNMFVYDSDTQDKTGQTRIGWSTWGGVQGDPYRWGRLTFPDWSPPKVETQEPVLPLEALNSLDSPQSIAQAVRTRVALAGLPAADPKATGRLEAARLDGDVVKARVRVGAAGTAHLFALDADGAVVGSKNLDLAPGVRRVPMRVDGDPVRVLLGYAPDAGGSTSTRRPVT